MTNSTDFGTVARRQTRAGRLHGHRRALSAVLGVVLLGLLGNAAPASAQDQVDCSTYPEYCLDNGLDNRAQAGEQGPSSAVDPNNPAQFDYTVEQYLDFISRDVDQQWSAFFVANQSPEPETWQRVIAPGETVVIPNCYGPGAGVPMTVTADSPNAWYCPNDVYTDANGKQWKGSVVFPVTTMQKMWTGAMFTDQRQSKERGDFAAAIIVAHEFGHSIQDELWQRFAASGYAVSVPTKPNIELIADCFAGTYMATTYARGVMTDTDYFEAVEAIRAIGDPEGSAPDHGTPEQRVQALQTGYNSGNGSSVEPAICVQKYGA